MSGLCYCRGGKPFISNCRNSALNLKPPLPVLSISGLKRNKIRFCYSDGSAGKL